ncbi:TlpA family protein disulfide reductase [Dyadobacter jiangsuensis]|uniref:Peroxiredoxin n=1 Tax=Dyadobacter jiangsuensis TaxID=1591085 RepID=A0A2P8GIT7_9BACT|nr:TlpA disulfide reductase family protein [Dyadobacter jiangsuensis]PSL33883.1 peroxiredoxin [Dyadobacter jiangsuensis]
MKIFFVWCLTVLFPVQLAFAGVVRIQGHARNATEENLQCTLISNNLASNPVGVAIPMKGERFSYQFDVAESTFLSFSDGTNYFGGFVDPGDSIVIAYDRTNFANSVSYTGKGKEKFEITHSMMDMKRIARSIAAAAKGRKYPVDDMFAAIDSLQDAIHRRIDLSANAMSAESAKRLLGGLAATAQHAKQSGLVAVFGDSYNNILANHRERLSDASIVHMKKLLDYEEALYDSRIYVDAVKSLASIHIEENLRPVTDHFEERKYQLLIEMLPQKLRTPVLFMTLKWDITTAPGEMNERVVLDAAELLADSQLKQIIQDLLTARSLLKSGDKAPEFSVQNLAGEKVDLASFHGKTIYLDFWFAGCGPCHALFKSIEPVKKHFEKDDRVVFLTVSIDNEMTWKRAIQKFSVKAYHVFTENKLREHPMIKSYNVTAYPSTYIIDPAGRFHTIQAANNPDMLKKQIEEAIASTSARHSR